jgi:hypothetical protein
VQGHDAEQPEEGQQPLEILARAEDEQLGAQPARHEAQPGQDVDEHEIRAAVAADVDDDAGGVARA